MTSHRKKRKTTVYLDPDVEKTLADFAAAITTATGMTATGTTSCCKNKRKSKEYKKKKK